MTSTPSSQPISRQGGVASRADPGWPLAGTAEFDSVPAAWRESLATKLERDLRRHVIDVWFPRTVDREAGGFLCDFDVRWRPRGAQLRVLEFQARQSRTAARLGIAFPADSTWPEICLHGLRYLREVMADPDAGGWFWAVDRSGTPLAGKTKHAHSVAYLLDAAVEVHRLTAEPDAAALARAAFDWLETHHHDAVNGGYFGWVSQDGSPILSADDAAARAPGTTGEPLRHGIGLKDANVHSDLLEAFTLLHETWPQEIVAERLREVYDVLVQRLLTPNGSMHYLAFPDWTPVPSVEQFGYLLQSGFRLPPAASLCGVPIEDAHRSLGLMVDHVLDRGWDELRGAFFEAAPAADPVMLSGHSLLVPAHPWWVQTEGLKALLLIGTQAEDGERYRQLAERLLATIDREYIDQRFGGWYPVAKGDLPWRATALVGRGLRKGDIWKDASHDADCYLTAIRILRGLHATDPISRAS